MVTTANAPLDYSLGHGSSGFDSTACTSSSSSLSHTTEVMGITPHTTPNIQNHQSFHILDPAVYPANDNIAPPSLFSSPSMLKHSTTTTASSSSSISKSSRGGARKKAPSSPKIGGDVEKVIEKRRNNTLAARRYRQKRLDHIEELESALAATARERDELKVKVARLEGELGGLKELLKSGSSRS